MDKFNRVKREILTWKIELMKLPRQQPKHTGKMKEKSKCMEILWDNLTHV